MTDAVKHEVLAGSGLELWLDPEAPGLHADLRRAGIREPYTTMAYRNALLSMEMEWAARSLTIVDIGANVGYYALQPPTHLDDDTDVTVIAIEPDPDHLDLLRRNIELNDAGDSVTVVEGGVSDSATTETLHRFEKSNLNTMNPNKEGATDAVEVDVRPLPAILDSVGVDVEDVDVLRMDIEGHEARALAGMRPIFEAADELLINIEVHPVLMEAGEREFLHALFAPNVRRFYSAAQADQQAVIGGVDEALRFRWMELVFDWAGDWPA